MFQLKVLVFMPKQIILFFLTFLVSPMAMTVCSCLILSFSIRSFRSRISDLIVLTSSFKHLDWATYRSFLLSNSALCSLRGHPYITYLSSILGCFWPFQPCLAIFDHFQTFFDTFGHFWTLLDPLGPSWTLLDPLGEFWTLLYRCF